MDELTVCWFGVVSRPVDLMPCVHPQKAKRPFGASGGTHRTAKNLRKSTYAIRPEAGMGVSVQV